jgi:hypothetical protein
LKKNKYHILHTWMLIVCFIAGQYMVYAHQHVAVSGINKVSYHNPNNQPKETLTENCRLCDAMHHSTMALANTTHFTPVIVSNYTYKTNTYTFISISLILSAGRSPPIA